MFQKSELNLGVELHLRNYLKICLSAIAFDFLKITFSLKTHHYLNDDLKILQFNINDAILSHVHFIKLYLFNLSIYC